MILNEILAKQNILNAILLKDGDNEVSKELKVKIVRLRISYNKIKKQVDEDIQEFTKTLIPEELTKLQAISNENKSEEDFNKIKELEAKVNSEYREFLEQKSKEEIHTTFDDSFTDSDFDELVGINAGNLITINERSVKGEELMEVFYAQFVNKN